jgi:DNA-binding transcriptional ArsR family regulator
MAFDSESLRAEARPAAAFLKAVSNERRLAIVCLLARSEMSVGELEVLVGVSQSALSQHLARLRRDRLVKTRREAQTIYYSLNGGKVLALLEALQPLFVRPREEETESRGMRGGGDVGQQHPTLMDEAD